jgi:hypothetical protein
MRPIEFPQWNVLFGPILNVRRYEGAVLVRIGKNSIILPIELEQKLLSLKGIQIGILHTDMPQNQYILRVLGSQSAITDHENEKFERKISPEQVCVSQGMPIDSKEMLGQGIAALRIEKDYDLRILDVKR